MAAPKHYTIRPFLFKCEGHMCGVEMFEAMAACTYARKAPLGALRRSMH